MDRGTKRCFKHVFLDANDVQLCALRRASGDQTPFTCGRIHHPGVNGKADADNLAICLVAYVKYIGKMIWPANLAVFYPYSDSLPGWQKEILARQLLLRKGSLRLLWKCPVNKNDPEAL